MEGPLIPLDYPTSCVGWRFPLVPRSSFTVVPAWFHGGKHGKSDHETRGGRGQAQRTGIFSLGWRIDWVWAASTSVECEELHRQISAWAGSTRTGAARDHRQ